MIPYNYKTILLYPLLAILFMIAPKIYAQEQLIPLSKNIELKGKKADISAKTGNYPAVKLPFIDDFSNNSIYPNPALWVSKSAYVNQRFGVNPPSIGVLTFDAVDDTGAVYNHAGQFAFIADTMYSNFIRLDSVLGNSPAKLSPSDSVYFSFYYQPQGLGNAPEDEDSLILHFYNPVLNQWELIWEHQGMNLDSFNLQYGSDFVKVMIPIVKADYFSSEFKFRFLNKASIPNTTIPSWRSGMYDQWNIDYVYIDKGRVLNEVSINDIAFTQSVSTLLLNYIAMPWNQYLANPIAETDTNAEIDFRNFYIGSNLKNVNQYFSIQNLIDNTTVKANPYPATFNMSSGQQVTYKPDYGSFTFQASSSDYADFEVMFRLLTNSPPPDIIRSNDTMRFYQRFYNYYAYDDGTPEAGYGLSNTGARLAYKFSLNQPDSLQAIQIYFNHTLNNANSQYFFLTVWDDQNGQPGNIIYEQSGVKPEFEFELFQYHNYVLDNPVYVSGTFYVGWRQTTVDNLNVGFDFNNDHHQKIFYNTGGSWMNSSFSGSLMIRPILGTKKEAIVGIGNQQQASSPELHIYPNPSEKNNGLTIEIANQQATDNQIYQVRIFSVQGKLIRDESMRFPYKITNLESGFYFIQVISDDGKVNLISKFIVR